MSTVHCARAHLRLAFVLVLVAVAWPLATAAAPLRDKECLVCHSEGGEENAPQIRLGAFRSSVHGEEGCISCHADVEDPNIAHEEKFQDLEKVDCGNCHEDQRAEVANSVHIDAVIDEDEGSKVSCADCHGSHSTRAKADPKSSIFPANLVVTCGGCHKDQRYVSHHIVNEKSESEFIRNDPSKYTHVGNVVVIAVCTDCHGTHNIVKVDEPASTLFRTEVVATCGRCHEEQRDEFRKSIHGRPMADADRKKDANGKLRERPVCTTCHKMHGNGTVSTDRFRADLVRECGTCHAELMHTYMDTYHGKATDLGSLTVAKCSDCHGYHGILPANEPDSRVGPAHKYETCKRCHEDATKGMAGFWTHADPHDKENYPLLYWVFLFMNILLISVFSFFGLHTLLWGVREAVDAIRYRSHAENVEHAAKDPDDGLVVQRFALYHRLTHFLVIISFLGLAATGAPLRYHGTRWARAIFDVVGGVANAGLLHRIFAVITFTYFAMHVGFLLVTLSRHYRNKTLAKTLLGPDSLVPRLSDLTDIIAHVKWFVGRGPRPTWDRWTYWEKFDYWAVFWGIAIIGTSGLFLWFPTVVSSFLPGWVINIALVVHADEALLAIGFIFGIHFFNSHLRRNKFPMDPVIFTGSMSDHEFREERGRQFERLTQEGTLHETRVRKPSRAFMAVVRVFGISAWLFGLCLLALILHGFFTQ